MNLSKNEFDVWETADKYSRSELMLALYKVLDETTEISDTDALWIYKMFKDITPFVKERLL